MRKLPLVILFLMSLAGCQKDTPQSTEQHGSAPKKVTVAFTSQPQSTLVHVALAKGYFAEEGLEVRSIMHSFGKAALQSVLDGQADFATVAETPVMFAALRGEKIFVIANIEATTKNNAIVARKDAGIAVPGDLRGKRVAFTPGTTSDFFLDSLLTANGLTRKEIHAVALKPEEMQQAIMSGKVDAACTWNYPLTEIKRQLGPKGIVFYDQDIYTETFNIAVPQTLVTTDPEAVKRFLRALIKAENFTANNPDAAQTIHAAAAKTDISLIREVWDVFSFRVMLDQTLPITLEDETRWAMRNKLTDKTTMPDYMSFIHQDSLRAVKPEAVNLPR